MTQQEIQQSLSSLNALVLEGKMMDAFEQYYHEDVSMQENTQPATVGKALNRARELEFLGNITEFRNASVQGIAVSDNISCVIWHYDYTHREWGERNYTQVSVQHWKDGKIAKEQFIYNN